MKRMITLAAMAFVAASLIACSIAVSKEDRASQLLRDRYNEEFEIVEAYPTFLGRGYYTVLAAPAESPGYPF